MHGAIRTPAGASGCCREHPWTDSPEGVLSALQNVKPTKAREGQTASPSNGVQVSGVIHVATITAKQVHRTELKHVKAIVAQVGRSQVEESYQPMRFKQKQLSVWKTAKRAENYGKVHQSGYVGHSRSVQNISSALAKQTSAATWTFSCRVFQLFLDWMSPRVRTPGTAERIFVAKKTWSKR